MERGATCLSSLPVSIGSLSTSEGRGTNPGRSTDLRLLVQGLSRLAGGAFHGARLASLVEVVLALARPGTEAILDDLAARWRAAALGVSVRGTQGLVLIAKRHGTLPAERPVLERLRCAGMYLSDRVIDETLEMVGE